MTTKPTAKATATEAVAAKAPVQPLTTREVADRIGTDPKTLRRFLRDPKSTFAAAGQGGRYAFTAKELPGLKKRFTAWAKAEEAARTARAAKAATKAAKAPKASGKVEAPEAPSYTSRELAEARVSRLETMLKASGSHISQHRI